MTTPAIALGLAGASGLSFIVISKYLVRKDARPTQLFFTLTWVSGILMASIGVGMLLWAGSQHFMLMKAIVATCAFFVCGMARAFLQVGQSKVESS